MDNLFSAVVKGTSALVLTSIMGCASSPASSAAASGGGGAATATAASYRGTYEVPVTADLASAATFDVSEVEWNVTSGDATLEYALPLGLVGKSVRVRFSGSFTASSTDAQLSGDVGTATCTKTGTQVSCKENMHGLVPLDPDYTVIEQVAASDYAGPASQRVDVAKQFASDPIGVVRFDLSVPSSDSSETEKHGGNP